MSGVKTISCRPAADFIQWDCLLPCLRDNSVDIIVTDLPFGKRSGSKADNRVLYPRTLLSLARVVRPGTGRAVLLTQDKNSMLKSLNKIEHSKQLAEFISEDKRQELRLMDMEDKYNEILHIFSKIQRTDPDNKLE